MSPKEPIYKMFISCVLERVGEEYSIASIKVIVTAMTKADWLACGDPEQMLAHLQGNWLKKIRTLFGIKRTRWGDHATLSKRKLRLFYCACCRQFCPAIEESPFGNAVSVAERYADELVDARGVRAAYNRVRSDSPSAVDFWVWWACDTALRVEGFFRLSTSIESAFMSYCLDGQDERLLPDPLYESLLPSLLKCRNAMAALLRDIFGNPFHPITPDPSWLTSNVTALAQTIYDDRAFDRMPILADALEDTGCDNQDILNHCRESGVHVRGCWVVDLLLEKE
jgi:hypothetical protein